MRAQKTDPLADAKSRLADMLADARAALPNEAGQARYYREKAYAAAFWGQELAMAKTRDASHVELSAIQRAIDSSRYVGD